MTRNLYLGASLERVIHARSVEEAIHQSTRVWATVQDSDVAARMERVAGEIAEARPHLVGLQEVSLWREGPVDLPPAGADTAATSVRYDFLELLLDALSALGEHYVPVTTSRNIDAELPVLDPASGRPTLDVRMTDRDVILARGDVRTTNATSGSYAARVPLTIGRAPEPQIRLVIPRGWNVAEVEVGGRAFRFVNTHLELDTPEGHARVQVEQAEELRRMLARDALPVILVGDLNSDAAVRPPRTTPTCELLRAAGFADAWIDAQPGEPGLTCGLEERLREETFTPGKRLDVILHRGPFVTRSVALVGGDPSSRTARGLWPSDHLGVVATLELATTAEIEGG